LSALALRLYDKLDLLSLTALGGTAEQAGLYGAAQNLALLPSLFALSVSPLLLSAVSRALRDGEGVLARGLGQQAVRGVFLLLPFAGLVAGSAVEFVTLVFGSAFRGSASLLSLLIFAAVALVFVSVATAILTAAGRPGLTLGLTGPLPLVALGGYLVFIPREGPLGAAFVTCLCAALSALAAMLAVHRVSHPLPVMGTAFRCGLVCVAAFTLAALWLTPGWLVLVKLSAISVAIPIALRLLGEFSALELAAMHGLRRRWTKTGISAADGSTR
jgi:O-antigen/teichoic acid export membrane protein